jgi:type IV pilus assembly protein PilC
MPEYVLKYADAKGAIRQQTLAADSEDAIREQLQKQGFYVYSVKPKGAFLGWGTSGASGSVDTEKFLIFNQQFVTLFKAGLPILKALDLLVERLTEAKLGRYVAEVRDDVRKGVMLSEAFERRGVFPPIYVTSVMAGEKSGALGEVLERFVQYQRVALGVKKKILVSLLYPAVLLTLVLGLVVFLVTYVVPNFAALYSSMSAELPGPTRILIAFGTAARSYVLVAAAAVVGGIVALRVYLRTTAGQAMRDGIIRRTPIAGEIWLKYQVSQFARLLSTILLGGIPLVQGLETASRSINSPLFREALVKAQRSVREGLALSVALKATGIFPGLSLDMIEVGESTGALPQMLTSVAEFYEEDVNTRMTAVMSLIEPAIMLIMGIFVAFVLVSLYLPIFSLTDKLGR